MRVDLVDRGGRHRPGDPIRSLAAALGGAGHATRLFSEGPVPSEELGKAELVRLATRRGLGRTPPTKVLGTLLDPSADVWILPFELLGSAALPAASGRAVRMGVLPAAETPAEDPMANSGWFARLFARRNARSAEARSLTRARWILAPGEAEREAFVKRLPKEAARTVVVPPTVRDPDPEPTREGARRALHLPDDVPVAALIAGPTGPAPSIGREAFQRARVFFPGARLLLVGPPGPTEPGVHRQEDDSVTTRSTVLAASDVILAPSGASVPDLISGLRRELAGIAGASVRLPRTAPDAAYRRPEAEEAGHYASDLAELFADPVLRRKYGAAGREAAEAYAPSRVAGELVRLAGSASPSGNSSSR